MKIIKKKKTNQPKGKFWDKVAEQSHYLIADKLNQVLPLANCRDKKVFNPNDDADYRTIWAEVEDGYGDDLPSQDQVSQEITYEYLFLVVKSLLGKLREFECHQEKYFEKL